MRCSADVTDLSLCLRFQHTFVHSCSIAGLPAGIHLMKLIYINIAAVQHPERSLKIVLKLLRCLGMCLRCNENMLSPRLENTALSAKCISDFLFRIAVCPRSVEEPHAAFIGALKQLCCVLLWNSLDWQCPECILRDSDSSSAKCNGSHALYSSSADRFFLFAEAMICKQACIMASGLSPA